MILNVNLPFTCNVHLFNLPVVLSHLYKRKLELNVQSYIVKYQVCIEHLGNIGILVRTFLYIYKLSVNIR